MNEPLRYEYGDKTILEIRALQEQEHLNLEPPFQRKSVWSLRDRRKLVQSILEGYPIPSIFLYHREENGRPVYDVIDGKQRLETVFMFTRTKGFKRSGFDVQLRLDDASTLTRYAWRDLERRGRGAKVLSYKIQTVEVSGDLSDIVNLFVRINSTGKALTGSERRHARFYTSPFLRCADQLARRFRSYFRMQHVMTEGNIDRMKDVELVCELLASIINGGPLHKKTAVDRVLGSQAFNLHTLRRAASELRAVMSSVRRLLPELRSTRFGNVSEFYSLFMVLWEMHQSRLVLGDRKRNRVAAALLKALSNGVDAVREMQRRAKGAGPGQRLFADYLLSVQQSTDGLAQRNRRAEILRGVLSGLFERKDDRRLFSPEQRRLLWNTEDAKTCARCGKKLSWTNFQVDHVKAFSRGGRTDLRNASLICRKCNASKGARRTRRIAA